MNITHLNQNAGAWPSFCGKEGALTGERNTKAESHGGTGTPQQKMFLWPEQTGGCLAPVAPMKQE
jgi:hypothetical protein